MPELKNIKISGLQSSVTLLPKPDKKGNMRFFDDDRQLLTEFNINSPIITQYRNALVKITTSSNFQQMTNEEKSEEVIAAMHNVFGGFDKRSLDFTNALNKAKNNEQRQEIKQSYFDYYNSRPRSIEKVYEMYGRDSMTCLNDAPLAQYGLNQFGINSYLVLCAQEYKNQPQANAHLTLVTEDNTALETTSVDFPKWSWREIRTSSLDETTSRLKRGEPIVTVIKEINNISAISTTKAKEMLSSDEVTKALKEAIENESKKKAKDTQKDVPKEEVKKPKDLSSANFEKVINLSIAIANSGVVMSESDYQIRSGKQNKSQQIII